MSTLRSIFLKGLAAIIPLGLTLYIIFWMGSGAESILGGVLQKFLPEGYYWPGMGLITGLLLIFITGILINAWVVRRFFKISETLLEKLPLVKTILNALRDLTAFLSRSKAEGELKQVVMVQYLDIKMIGFLTHNNPATLLRRGGDEDLIAVYLPMSYQIGGYTVFIPRSRVTPLDLSVEDAMRIVLTAGLSARQRGDEEAEITPQAGPR
ncbi:MAG: DUF502 domain-containing protein [Pseudomonadota bacterium]